VDLAVVSDEQGYRLRGRRPEATPVNRFLEHLQAGAFSGESNTTVTMTYDHDGRLQTVSNGNPAQDTVFTYNTSTALLEQVTDAAGATTLTYDPNGLLDTLDDPITAGAIDYGYDSAGRVTTRTDPGPGLSWSRTYSPDTGRVDTQSVTQGSSTLLSANLGYDKAGNVTSRTQSVNGADQSWSYTYDPASRLETATKGSDTWTYAYDGAGNRSSVKLNSQAPVTTYYDSAGNPVSSSEGTTYSTDPLGNLTGVDAPGSSNDLSFTYDTYSRQKTATAGGSSITYALDGLSRVVSRTKGSATTTYAYRGTESPRVYGRLGSLSPAA